MRNSFYSLLAMLLVTILFVSCEDKTGADLTDVIPTISVPIAIDMGSDAGTEKGGNDGINTPKSTNPDVSVGRRASIPEWVSRITIAATNQTNGHSAFRNYDIEDNPSLSTDMELEDVALGRNDFAATAVTPQTGTPVQLWGRAEVGGNKLTFQDAPQLMLERRGQAPDVQFNGRVDDVTVFDPSGDPSTSSTPLNTIEDDIVFNMEANAGRLIAYIGFEDNSLLEDYVAVVTPTVTYADGGVEVLSTQHLRGNWQNGNAFLELVLSSQRLNTGSTVCFRIVICEVSDNAQLTVSRTEELCYTIENGVSFNCILQIDEDRIKEEVRGFEFEFDWVEVYCEDGDCSINVNADDVSIVPFDFFRDIVFTTLCEEGTGASFDVSPFYWSPDRLTNGEFTTSSIDGTNVFQVVNGTSTDAVYVFDFSGGASLVVDVPANTAIFALGPNGTVVNGGRNAYDAADYVDLANRGTLLAAKSGTITANISACN